MLYTLRHIILCLYFLSSSWFLPLLPRSHGSFIDKAHILISTAVSEALLLEADCWLSNSVATVEGAQFVGNVHRHHWLVFMIRFRQLLSGLSPLKVYSCPEWPNWGSCADPARANNSFACTSYPAQVSSTQGKPKVLYLSVVFVHGVQQSLSLIAFAYK